MSATWMLCLDASAPRTCVALGRVEGDSDDLQVIDELEDRANQTSTTLDLRLRAALAHVGIAAAQLGVIACGRGPGTFTGSRRSLLLHRSMGACSRCSMRGASKFTEACSRWASVWWRWARSR